MSDVLPKINPSEEAVRISDFIKGVMRRTGKNKAVIAVSGGVDSATSLFLLCKSISRENIFAVSLPYFEGNSDLSNLFDKAGLPASSRLVMSIKSVADEAIKQLNVSENDAVRRGNIMARTRMIALYDLSKKLDALVCGTENKSEALLGYFTRFGDEASDLEPIQHLFKTQVYELARHLGVPDEILSKKPTAGLWEGQTDEGEFGFTYEEADQVLHLYLDENKTIEEIQKEFKNAEKIIEFAKKNEYKHHVPYRIEN